MDIQFNSSDELAKRVDKEPENGTILTLLVKTTGEQELQQTINRIKSHVAELEKELQLLSQSKVTVALVREQP